MWKQIRPWLVPVPEMSALEFYFRVLLALVQIIAAYAMSEKANPFFYQRF